MNFTSDGDRIANNECIFFRQDGATAHAACSLIVVLRKVLGDRIISRLSWSARSCDCYVFLKKMHIRIIDGYGTNLTNCQMHSVGNFCVRTSDSN
jgi:hypothetical protein